jgi:nitrilase
MRRTDSIDTARLRSERYKFDPVGHYARPDLFQLHVDETSRSPVMFHNTASAVVTADSDRKE